MQCLALSYPPENTVVSFTLKHLSQSTIRMEHLGTGYQNPPWSSISQQITTEHKSLRVLNRITVAKEQVDIMLLCQNTVITSASSDYSTDTLLFLSHPSPSLPPPATLILHLFPCCLPPSIFSLITLHLSVNSRPFRGSSASRKCQKSQAGPHHHSGNLNHMLL